MRRIWISALALALCGCTPVLQQKVKQEQADQQIYSAQSRERDAADRCNQAAVPGSMEHMECRLGIPAGPPPAQP